MFKLADIYLTVSPEPKEEFLSQREKVISSLETEKTVSAHFLTWIELVWLGVPVAPVGTVPKGVASIIAAIQGEQPSFPSDPKERELDLRVTTAAVLYRYLSKELADRGCSLSLSAVILAASKFRTLQLEPRYNAFVETLRLKAQSVFDKEAEAIRKRKTIAPPNVAGGDFNTIISSTNEALTRISEAVMNNMRVEREELQVLWWVFGRYSKLLHAPYDSIACGDAAISSATELSSLMLLPPVPAAKDFLQTVLKEKPIVSLGELIAQTSMTALNLVRPPNNLQSVVRDHPALLPLTWISDRLIESDRSPWETEFEKKSRLSASLEQTTSTWAEQLFAERIAVLLLGRDLQTAENA